MGLKEREFCIYPDCNCPIDKTTICARGLPEPEEVKMDDGVWTEWLENPGTRECPVPEWAESHQVVLVDGMESPVNDLNPKNWKWSDDCGGEITHYRYQVPSDLAWLAENVSEFPAYRDYVVLDKQTRQVYFDCGTKYGKSYDRCEWLRARRDLGYQTPGAESQIFGADAQIPGAEQPPSKYHRNIKGVYVDVYDIIHAYGITNPGDQHAIKKMLQPGQRGYKSSKQDREEAIVSLERANELEDEG